jgi:hypothetical protein
MGEAHLSTLAWMIGNDPKYGGESPGWAHKISITEFCKHLWTRLPLSSVLCGLMACHTPSETQAGYAEARDVIKSKNLFNTVKIQIKTNPIQPLLLVLRLTWLQN